MLNSDVFNQEMLDVPVVYIFGAFIPATMIAVLYYFDHSVVSQLAQQKEFNLRKPSCYHYDLLILGFLVSDCKIWGELSSFPFLILPFSGKISHYPQSMPLNNSYLNHVTKFCTGHYYVAFLGFLLPMELFLNLPCILRA